MMFGYVRWILCFVYLWSDFVIEFEELIGMLVGYFKLGGFVFVFDDEFFECI